MQRVVSFVLLISAGGVMGCSKAPAEPEPAPAPSHTPTATREPLKWLAPPSWTLTKSADAGKYRAKYEVPAQGDAKHPAELLVYRLTDKKGAAAAELDDLAALFEGDEAKQRKRDKRTLAGGFEVELLDIGGTYRFPMGPSTGRGKKRHVAHVLKENWRALAASVATPKQGTWIFQLVGPRDTVESARGAFSEMIDKLH